MVELGTSFDIKKYDPRMKQGEKQIWRLGVVEYANRFIGALPDDTDLSFLLHKKVLGWKAYMDGFGNEARGTVTKILGTVARLMHRERIELTLGKARIFDAETLISYSGIGLETADLIVVLVKPVKAVGGQSQQN